MKNEKYVFFSLIILIGLLSISFASADANIILDENTQSNIEELSLDSSNENLILDENDDNTFIDHSDEDLILDKNEDSGFIDTNEKTKLSDSNTYSFTKLNETINSENTVIDLTDNYKYMVGDEAFVNGIIINRSITINGNGITLDGSNTARIFNITGNNVTINNITFINGRADGNTDSDRKGGAILWNGANGTLSNSTFNNNTKAEYGGAVDWYGNNGAIINSIFNDNYADKNGGAIYWDGENGAIRNSTFNNNSARGYGGAIAWEGMNGITSYSAFINNNAAYGGVINCYAEYNNVSYCLFVNNTAENDGTVYYNDYDENTYSNFTNNILLNNGEGEIHFKIFEGCNADYNWFGNNASNYNQKPYDKSNTWLFLNGTANPNVIRISDISEITFKLYSYNGNKIAGYDNSKLYPINLSLSSTKGTLSKDTARLSEAVTFQTDSMENATVSAIVEDAQTYITIAIADGTSFWDLNKTINDNNDTEITLNKNYTYNPDTDFAFIHGIIINRTVTINGNNNTINGSDLARIFHITGDNVIINNIIFTNGNATGNSISDQSGGAILWNGAKGSLNNSTFNNNTAETEGGAIQWYGEDGTVSNSTFNSNTANRYGGAILWEAVNGAISNSTFNNNKANTDGGSIYWDGEDGTVNNSTFNNNKANTDGGAVYWNEVNGAISNSTFNNNTAKDNGGAVYWKRTNGTLNNSTFNNNKANTDGGSILWEGNNGTLNNSTFNSNTAEEYGGAVLWKGQNGVLSNSTFNNNTSNNEGGAIKWQGTSGAVNNSTFNNNTAVNGGAIHWTGANGALNNSIFNNNTARMFGGAVRWEGANGNISNSTFNNNNAGRDGGAILCPGESCAIINSTFNNNKARNGGAIDWGGEYGNVTSCLFVNNTATTNGSVYYNGYSRKSFSNFTNNILLNNGPDEIYYEVFNGSNADYNWFGNNASEYDRKPYDQSNTWLFINGTADPEIIIVSDISEIVFKLYAYDGNEISEYDNSALYPINLSLSSTKGTISDETVGLNEKTTFQADSMGNVQVSAKVEDAQTYITITITDETSFWALNRTINGNNDTEITLDKNYTYNPETDHAFIQGIIINRTVRINGNNNTINGLEIARIFNIIGNNVTINTITFINGTADENTNPDGSGGAILWNGENGTLSNSTFNNNKANSDGGAILWNGKNGTISNSTFNNNTALTSGGAIQWHGMNGVVSNSTFNNNTAYYGGAIQWHGMNGVVSNSTFNNNTARNGGAIRWNNINGVVSNSTFNNNNASHEGGAIIWSGINSAVTNSTFNNNNARNGGAITLYGRYGNVSSCLFVNNTAKINGSAYYNNYEETSYSNFTNNILLNNGPNEIYYKNFEGSNADYNWFGNNASDYNQKPYDQSNVWLFINGTADPEQIPVLSTSNIRFKLYAYDEATGEIIEFNNQIYPITLRLSSTNGTLSKNTAGLGEDISYTPESYGIGRVTASIENRKSTITIESIPEDAELEVSIGDNVIDYGENATIILEFNQMATGTVNITVTGKKHEINITDGELKETILIPGLNPDEYTITVSYSGDNKFIPGTKTASTNLTVNKANPTIKVQNATTEWNVPVSIPVSVEGAEGYPATGMVIVTVDWIEDNKSKVYNLEDGIENVTFKIDETVGECTITVKYFGDENYNEANATATLTITGSTDLKLEVSANEPAFGEDAIITIKGKSGEGAYIPISKANITINGETSEFNVNEDGTVNLGKLAVGNTEITVSVNDGIPDAAEAKINVTVAPAGGLNIVVEAEDYLITSDGELAITISNEAQDIISGTATIEIDGRIYKENVTVENNKATIQLTGLADGKHIAKVTFNSPNYESVENITTFTASKATPTITVEDTTTEWNVPVTIPVSVAGVEGVPATGTVIVTVNWEADGVTETFNLEEGTEGVTFKIDETIGECTVTARYLGDENYNAVNATATLTITGSTELNVEVTDNSPIEGQDLIITVTATDGRGAEVPITKVNLSIDGEGPTEIELDEKGNANLGKLTEGPHTVVISINDGVHQEKTVTKEIVVNPTEITPTEIVVTVENISYGARPTIEFTFKDINGNPLSGTLNVTVADKQYPVTVNADGKGTLTIQDILPADTYSVVANFAGNQTHTEATGTAYFSIAKNATMIIFENMQTKAVDPKADGRIGEWFYFTLKDANGNPIANAPMEIGFNGVVYTYEKDGICTDENGIAKLQINLGYKGDYTFAICYLGNQSYNASFVVAKITVNCQTPTLTVPNKSYAASAKTKTLTVTFKNEHGKLIADKQISFTVNGKTYKAKTNSKGVASVNVSLNKKGTYTVVAKYAGASTYNAVSKKAKLTIK